MRIRIKGYIPYEKELEYFFSEATINYFLDAVKYGAIKSHDEAFRTQVWHLAFEEPYDNRLFGGGTDKAERVARRESKAYLRHLESIKAKLPFGVAMQIEERTYTDGYGRKSLEVVFSVYASVTAEYSKKCYAEISKDNIVHDWDMSAAFINAAKAFKDRILVTKNELIHAIKDECSKSYRFDVAFYESNYCNYYDCYSEDSTTYKSRGLVDLRGLEQCYGLAWAVATLSSPTERYLLKIVDDDPLNHFSYNRGPNGQKTKVARITRFVKESSKQPQLAEW